MKMKTCFRCETKLPLTEFYVHPQMADGHLNKCKQCSKADVSANYRNNLVHYKEYELARNETAHRKKQQVDSMRRRRRKEPHKYKARTAVGNALRDGRLSREPCVVCGTTENLHAHHEDYYRPLAVTWLCEEHHRRLHQDRGEKIDWTEKPDERRSVATTKQGV